MSHDKADQIGQPEILLSSKEFFKEVIEEAFLKLSLPIRPAVGSYLVHMLEHYILSDNLFETQEGTGRRSMIPLAEMFLRANQTEEKNKKSLLKKLADTSLYISGFFGDSLKRKVVDLDYYIDLGGTAYAALAATATADTHAHVFGEFSENFPRYVDVLAYVSQKSMVQSNEDLLRLYDRYVMTGSSLAKEALIENGILNASSLKNSKKQ